MWPCHVICRAWRLAHSSTRVWKEWHCQAVLRAWYLGTTSTGAWKKWLCQAIYEALDLALDFERVCSMWHYQVVFGPCRYAALTIPTALCWSALCENPGSEKVTVIWLIHWNWGKPIFRYTHVFQIAMSVTHRNGCNWTEKATLTLCFFWQIRFETIKCGDTMGIESTSRYTTAQWYGSSKIPLIGEYRGSQWDFEVSSHRDLPETSRYVWNKFLF